MNDESQNMTELAETSGEPMLRWFEYRHLPEEHQKVSRLFATLAYDVVIQQKLVRSAERTACLRKLLEAKDAGVRAALLGAEG